MKVGQHWQALVTTGSVLYPFSPPPRLNVSVLADAVGGSINTSWQYSILHRCARSNIKALFLLRPNSGVHLSIIFYTAEKNLHGVPPPPLVPACQFWKSTHPGRCTDSAIAAIPPTILQHHEERRR
jgi:hypothetical protein